MGEGEGQASAPSRRPLVIVLAVLVAVCVVAGVALVVLLAGDDDSAESADAGPPSTTVPLQDVEAARLAELLGVIDAPDPDAEAFPAPVDLDGDRGWIEGDGSAVLVLADQAKVLWLEGDEGCEAVIATLDAEAPPEAVRDAIGGVQDPVTGEVLTSLSSAVGRVAAVCGDGEVDEELLGRLAWQWAVVERRLAEMGVER